MAKFARLIEVGENQVLLMVTYDNDDEMWVTSIMSEFEGYTGELRASFDEKWEALGLMNEYTLEAATEFINNVSTQFTG